MKTNTLEKLLLLTSDIIYLMLVPRLNVHHRCACELSNKKGKIKYPKQPTVLSDYNNQFI